MTVADPTHEQAIAALADASRLTRSLPGAVSVPKTPITRRVLHRWFNGGVWASCDHLPTPQVCFGLGTWPGYLMCAECLTVNAEVSANTCDWCQAEAPQLYPAAHAIGPAIVVFAFCRAHLVQVDCDTYRATTYL